MSDQGEQKQVTHETVVHKANIPLVTGESVQDFTQAMSDAARKWVMDQLKMDPKQDYAYVVDVYSSVVVLSVNIYSKSEDKRGKYMYSAATYERDAETGVFTFSNLSEVQRVTTYKPKTVVKTYKGKGGPVEHAEPIPGQGADGWAPVNKALWSGVL